MLCYDDVTHRIHGNGIFAYIWLICMANVGKYTNTWILWTVRANIALTQLGSFPWPYIHKKKRPQIATTIITNR